MVDQGRTAAGMDDLLVVTRWMSDVAQMARKYTRKTAVVVEDQRRIAAGAEYLVPGCDVVQMMERSRDPHMRRR